MLKGIAAAFRRSSGLGGNAPATQLPAGMRIYVIGDIHGRLDLLEAMRRLIDNDLARARPEKATVVLLGDYVDRGPDSKAVVESLATVPFPMPSVFLLGNHEAMLLSFLDRPAEGETWWKFGGLETAHSYGVEVADLRRTKDFEQVAEQMRAAMPQHHLDFFRNLRLSYALGQYYFCHAGVRPGVPLESQRSEDLLWIREGFVDCLKPLGAIVVHGHTPSEQPSIRVNAIGVDTGAYITGRLTCLVVSSTDQYFLST